MLDDQSLANILKRVAVKDRSAVKGKIRMATDGITDRTLVSAGVLRAMRELLDEEGNAFTHVLCTCLDKLKAIYFDDFVKGYFDKKYNFDFLRFASHLKKQIDEIVVQDAIGMSYEDTESLRNLLSLTVNLAIDYSSLARLSLSYESKHEQIKNARGLFGKKVVCEGCKRKRPVSIVMICNGCGLMFCNKCAGHFGSHETCPSNCGYGVEPVSEWAER